MATGVLEHPPKTRDQLMTELRMLIPVLGVREAARQLGMSEDTAKTWAVRYGMTANPAVKRAMDAIPSRAMNVKPIETNGGQIMANVVREEILQTRLSHARVARRAASALEQKPDHQLTDPEYAPTVLVLGKHAALVGGWNADSRPDSPGKAFGSREQALVLDAELVEDSSETEPGPSLDVNDY